MVQPPTVPSATLSDPDPLRICLATSELTPLSKTGGLADVTASLSAYLYSNGHDIRVLTPFYESIDVSELGVLPVDFLQGLTMTLGQQLIQYSIDVAVLPGSGLSVYLLRCPQFYSRDGLYTRDHDEHLRFILLSRAAIEMCQRMGFAPQIFSCHDWHTALIPLYLKTVYAWDQLFAGTRSLLTIHNIGYQGVFSADALGDLALAGGEGQLHQDDLALGRINFLKTGVLHATGLSTVSPTYAVEIQREEYGMGLEPLLRARRDHLWGILNGVDYAQWNPATDALLPANYSMDDMAGKALCKQALMDELQLEHVPGQPLLGVVTRLVGQKGIDLMQAVLPGVLQQGDVSLAVLGSGEPRYEQFFSLLQQAFPGRVSFYRGFNNKLAHWIEAGSDLFLMPSAYEPCGLNQLYSLKYGTVPIVRHTGGLADSVQPVNPDQSTGTGVVFRDYNEEGLSWAINTGLALYRDRPLWRQIIANGMAMDYSWDRQGALYVALFRQLS